MLVNGVRLFFDVEGPRSSCQADPAAALPAHLVRFERFAACGHGVLADARERGLAAIRRFVTEE